MCTKSYLVMFLNTHLDHQAVQAFHFLSGSVRTGHTWMRIISRQHFKIRTVKKFWHHTVNSDLMQFNLPKMRYNLATSLEMTTAKYLNSLLSFLVIFLHVESHWWHPEQYISPDGWQRYCIPSKPGCSENNSNLQPGKRHLETSAFLLVWHTQKRGFLVPTRLQLFSMTFDFWSLSWSTRRYMT